MSAFRRGDRVRIVRVPTEWWHFDARMHDLLGSTGTVDVPGDLDSYVGVEHGTDGPGAWLFWPVDCLAHADTLPINGGRLDDVHALLTSRTGWTVDKLSSELRAIGACDPGLCGVVASMLLVGAL